MKIIDEWNHIAKERLIDRLNGNDRSYSEILLPKMLSNINKYYSNSSSCSILDFGCGTGELTFEVSKLSYNILGLDISNYSIELANEYFRNENLSFLNKSLFETDFKINFECVIANMSLMDTKDLIGNLKLIHKALKIDGKLLVTITHPSFWPIYWDYFNDNDFNYNKESRITRTFKTQNKIFEGYKTSHFHRPVSYYLNSFIETGFKVVATEELGHPEDNLWYPRFLYLELEK
ncbi:class I SAM-dependent methyltransferase [Flavobacterium quisquiliarum]|uniref:Class I SAM-dependent methyltransferase n=1 Tax=Flavobacterium quisquiliarum TaxID=1834436 RepID=A0ABV8W846_9FLAO|nr:class I SAM-dependent methyltransferase [Flavobacterium quisquiliarum]MBW1654923.1 methyltransferase domain-containing protein [Flavobacterium quisquiliarum]